MGPAQEEINSEEGEGPSSSSTPASPPPLPPEGTTVPLKLNLKNHCLFCLEAQPPGEMIELIKSNPKKVLTFQPILQYLTGMDPNSADDKDKKGGVPLMRNMPPLCGSCYDSVAELYRLHNQLLDTQWLIKKQIEAVRRTVRKARDDRPKRMSARMSFLSKFLKMVGKGISGPEFEAVRKFVDDFHLTIISNDNSKEAMFPSKLPPNYVPSEACDRNRNLDPLGNHSDLNSTTADSPMNDDHHEMMETESGMESHDNNAMMDNQSNTRSATASSKSKVPLGRPVKRKRVRKPYERKKKLRKEPAHKCDLCGEPFPVSELHHHLGTHVKDYVTKCISPSCPLTFSCPLKMERHVKQGKCRVETNLPKGLWTKQCESCDFNTELLREFKNHLILHEEAQSSEEKALPCPVPNCSEKFGLKQSLEIHISQHDLRRPETSVQAQRCPVCKKYVRVNYMKSHLKKAHQVEDTVPCDKCPYIFHNEEARSRHAVARHTFKPQQSTCTAYRYSCNICEGVKFQRAQLLRQHYLTVHSISRHIVCELCGEDFINEGGLVTHKKRMHSSANLQTGGESQSHTRKLYPYQCDLCPTDDVQEPPLKFSNGQALRSHKMEVHGISACCKYCAQSFTSIPNLKQHEEEHASSGETAKFQFSCNIGSCDKVFMGKNGLKSHQQVKHKQELIFVCSYCGKAYGYKNILDKHVNSVHLKITHICDTCGLSFKHKDSLQNHLLVHSGAGEKSHQCPICNKAFLYKSMMRAHIKYQHRTGKDGKERKVRTRRRLR